MSQALSLAPNSKPATEEQFGPVLSIFGHEPSATP
jgi:acyl-CoA reductase-like NAD-dependent aldehyde dehydrogenase